MTISADFYAICVGTPNQTPHYFTEDWGFRPIKDAADLSHVVEFETKQEALDALSDLPPDMASAYVVKLSYDIILKAETV